MIFVSHSSADRQVVDKLCVVFDDEDIKYWISSRDIDAGSDWSETIVDAIDACASVVLVLSRQANDSPQVKRELARAVDLKKPVIPFRIDDCRLSKSMSYFVSTQHWLDAATPPLEPHLSRLVEIVVKMQSGNKEAAELVERYTQQKRYWTSRRLLAMGVALSLLVACTFGAFKLIAQSNQLASEQATREGELLDEARMTAMRAEENAVTANAQRYAATEFSRARKVRLEGDHLLEDGDGPAARQRWAVSVELFENAKGLAEKRESVSLAKRAFVEELSGHQPKQYEKNSGQWHELVLLASRAERLARTDKHDEASNEFKRAQDAILLAIPIYRALKYPMRLEASDLMPRDLLEYCRELHSLPIGTFVLSADATLACERSNGVSLQSKDMPLEDVLRLCLRQVRDDLDFVVQNDRSIFVLTQNDKANSEQVWVNALEETRDNLNDMGVPGVLLLIPDPINKAAMDRMTEDLDEAKKKTPEQRRQKPFALPSWEELFGSKAQGLAHLKFGEVKEAIPILSEANEQNPNDIEVYDLLVGAYVAVGKMDLAVQTSTKRIEIGPRDASGYFLRGRVYDKTRDYDSAIKDLTEAIRLDTDDAEKYHWRGGIWIDTGEWAKGIADFTEVIRLSPGKWSGYSSRAFALMRSKEHARAIADYNEAIRLDPSQPFLYLYRSSCWKVFKEYEKAASDLRAAVRIDAKDAEALNSLAWLLSTCPKDSVRNGAEAVKHAMSANELSGWTSPDYLDTLAAAQAESGEFDKAVAWQTKAWELAPEEQKSDYLSRISLYKAGKPFRAD
jgi:tetratricopeptide (TPR) repeat protein